MTIFYPPFYFKMAIRLRRMCTSALSPNIALVLSGCGVFDGAEIQESVSAIVHLSRSGAQFQCFAPNIDQTHVINHAKVTRKRERK